MLCFQSCGLRSVPLSGSMPIHPSHVLRRRRRRTTLRARGGVSCTSSRDFWREKEWNTLTPFRTSDQAGERQGAHRRRRAHHPHQQPGPLAHTPDAHLPGGRPAMPARAHLPPLAAAAVAEPIVFASVSIATSSSLCWQGARQVPLARSAQGLSGRG